METISRKLIRMLEQDGWVLDRVNGDHHTFKHPNREKLITVTHPRREFANWSRAANLQTRGLATLNSQDDNTK